MSGTAGKPKRALVHIGWRKTGTTSIQAWLEQNSAALAARGIGYERMHPEGLSEVSPSQLEVGLCGLSEAGVLVRNDHVRRSHGLETLADQRAFTDAYAARMEAVLSRMEADIFVISSEHIESWTETPEEVAGLDRFLHRYFDEVRYVSYIRRQEAWLLSNYSQDLRTGDRRALDTYVTDNAVVDYAAHARLWAGVVGRDRFMLRLGERAALPEGDVVVDFASLLGTSANDTIRPYPRNQSLSAVAAEFLLQANRLTQTYVDGGRVRNPLLNDIAPRLTALSVKGAKLALNPGQTAHIRAANAASNEALRGEFFPEKDTLFPPAKARPPAPPPTPEEMAWIALEILFAVRLGEIPALTKDEVALVAAAVAERRAQAKAKIDAKSGKRPAQ